MPVSLNSTQRLAEHILQQPLATYVAEKRRARPRWSWALIAEQLATDTNGEVDVGREALRAWYRADELAEAS